MKTIDVPWSRSAAQDADELGGLLRGEHGRRLVEHEDPRAAVQRAEDLDALLLPDGDVLDARVGVDAAARSARTARACAGARRAMSSSPPRRGSSPSTRFSATVMTGMSMKCWKHHADPVVASPRAASRS